MERRSNPDKERSDFRIMCVCAGKVGGMKGQLWSGGKNKKTIRNKLCPPPCHSLLMGTWTGHAPSLGVFPHSQNKEYISAVLFVSDQNQPTKQIKTTNQTEVSLKGISLAYGTLCGFRHKWIQMFLSLDRSLFSSLSWFHSQIGFLQAGGKDGPSSSRFISH